jgi:nickel-dependent lactate racemase
MTYYYSYYPKFREINIPDANLIGVFGPLETPHPDREKTLTAAFASPVNTAPLEDLAQADDRVLIVLDDALEPTPTVFPFYRVIQRLHKAGVPDENITVLIANATHRASTNEEVDRKLGAEMRQKYAVYQSALNERDDSYHAFGTLHTEAGPMSVVADRRLKDASLIIGIGGVYPSRFKGFTGGGSLVFPGVANAATMGEVYLEAAELAPEEVLGHAENPARSIIRELLDFLPAFKFCVDVVVDRTGAIVSCVTGAPKSVYRVSADVAARMCNFTVPEKADIVVIDSHPFDHNLFQASHALYAALSVLKAGGEIVLVSPLYEPLRPHSTEMAKNNLANTKQEILAKSRKGDLAHFPASGAQLAALREVLDRTSHVTVVTSGATSDPKTLWFYQASNAQSAIDAAMERKGKDARVLLITHGGMAVPRVTS